MAKRARPRVRKTPLPVRSVKAGRPPEERVLAPRVRRRQRSASAAVSKGTTMYQASDGTRGAWPASRPMFKKG